MTNLKNNGIKIGTGGRAVGKQTAAKIVHSAYETLLEGGGADFTMRKIADRAGVRLANLQYYFPRMENLIRALMTYVGELYDVRYNDLLETVEDDPLSRFKAAIELNIDDVNNPQTRHFFIQFWPFLGVADNYTGELLAEFYSPQHKQFEDLIRNLAHDLPEDEISLRAAMITALFEGLLVTTESNSKNKKASRAFSKAIMKTSLDIATR